MTAIFESMIKDFIRKDTEQLSLAESKRQEQSEERTALFFRIRL